MHKMHIIFPLLILKVVFLVDILKYEISDSQFKVVGGSLIGI